MNKPNKEYLDYEGLKYYHSFIVSKFNNLENILNTQIGNLDSKIENLIDLIKTDIIEGNYFSS